MSNTSQFEREFENFLDRVGFPGGLSVEQSLTFADTMVQAVAVKLMREVGAGRISMSDLVWQGGGGGGGPHIPPPRPPKHRLDLLVRYCLSAANLPQTPAAPAPVV